MADKKISQLTALTTPATDDLLAIVDITANETKKITVANLLSGLLTNPITADLDMGSAYNIKFTTAAYGIKAGNYLSIDPVNRYLCGTDGSAALCFGAGEGKNIWITTKITDITYGYPSINPNDRKLQDYYAGALHDVLCWAGKLTAGADLDMNSHDINGILDIASFSTIGGTAPVTDGTYAVYNDGATSGQITSITTKNGIITAIAVIP
jgi:hypothetical protein